MKSRSSTFGAIGKLCLESVVVRNRRRVRATRPLLAHQPGDALAADALAGAPELGVDARAAVPPLAGRVHRHHLLGQILVATSVLRPGTALVA